MNIDEFFPSQLSPSKKRELFIYYLKDSNYYEHYLAAICDENVKNWLTNENQELKIKERFLFEYPNIINNSELESDSIGFDWIELIEYDYAKEFYIDFDKK
jgi:hypothetical protein